jgi:hypothetical protein
MKRRMKQRTGNGMLMLGYRALSWTRESQAREKLKQVEGKRRVKTRCRQRREGLALMSVGQFYIAGRTDPLIVGRVLLLMRRGHLC